MTDRSSFTVPANHPVLSGHFPGAPVVPGVVVLDRVLEAAERSAGPLAVSGLRQVKFHAPLLPGEAADIALELAPGALKFTVTRGGQLIAQGSFTTHASSPRDSAGAALREASGTMAAGHAGATESGGASKT